MKKNRILGMVVAGIMAGGLVALAGPRPPPAPPAAPPQAQPGQITAPPATVAPPTVEEVGLGRELIVITRDEPPVVAPGRHNAVAGGYFNSMNFNALFRIHTDTLTPVEDLVESWVAVSDTVFEFTLREGVQFHNGDILTAHDVVASWDYVRNYPDARANRLSIVYYEAIDDRTVRVDTETPNAMLFIDLCHSSNMIMPASLIEQGHDFNELPVGTGPFVFQEWRTGDSLSFTAFENHHDRDRAARVEAVTWRIIPEGASRTIALETGEGHFNIYVALPDVARLQAHPDIVVETFPGVGHNKLLMNNDLEIFQDVRVRRAMGMAIDKEAVALVGMEGFAFPEWAQVPTVFPGATREGVYSFDPEGAKALLAETGIDPATLGFTIIASNEERRRMGEVFQANLRELGIPVEIEMNDLATTLARTTDGDYMTGFGGFNASSFLGYVRGVLHINSIDGSNRSRIRHQEISDLIDQAIATIDASARLPIYEQISRLANEHTGHIPTHMTMNVRAFSANLSVPELSSAGGLNINMMYWRD